MRKKILYLSQLYPCPPDGGGKIKTLNTLQALARTYDISAVFVSETNPAPEERWELEKLGIKVKVFYNPKILASVKDDLLNLAWNFLRGRPHYLFQYTHQPAFPYIRRLVETFKPDIIHVDHLNMAQYLPPEKKQVWILEHHNVESYLYWTRLLHSAKPTRKLYLLIEMVLTYFFEKKTLKLFDHIFAISEVEAERVKRIFGVSNVSAQPLVYSFQPIKKIKHGVPYLLFIGNQGWPPNEDTVEWFIRKIFPRIVKKVPNVELHVVGKRNPVLEMRLPKLANVFLHGFQRKLEPYLACADIFVLPFRMGAGLRLKSLTALVAGLPIVSTLLGVEGLKLQPGKDYLLGNNPGEFADQVIYLLRSTTLRRKLSQNAKRYAEMHHGLDQNIRFLKMYKEAISKSS